MLRKFSETKKGLVRKFAFFAVTAISLAYYGKSRASDYKHGRHIKESDALVNSEFPEFEQDRYYAGKNEGSTEYKRVSQYVGAGNSYSSRKTGDRFSFYQFVFRNRD